MGFWGHGVQQNDTVSDVEIAFEAFLKKDPDVAAATEHVKKQYATAIDDEDEAPLIWQALANMQWTYGILDPQVLEKVRADLKSGIELESWRAESEADYQKRKAATEKFIAKLETPRPKPKKMPKVVLRKPKFAAGDCLSVKHLNGQFGAVFVTVANDSNPEDGYNLVVVLDYLSNTRPTLDVFKVRKWLKRDTPDGQGNSAYVLAYDQEGYHQAKQRLEIVGNLPVEELDPKRTASGASWITVGDEILRDRGLLE
ncbi:hypothetical protein Pan258_22440 [Symmachiella dynata]|uniref:hypothetical protein n=1 Tax=Symmachiella dynata TaxID=2527995 RepID=UPI001189559D|nr:hypothetical protein [Symmachiella dynata]QDT48204.1 hypothetical protein Pan258_22440 [Symmachiella dynata]